MGLKFGGRDITQFQTRPDWTFLLLNQVLSAFPVRSWKRMGRLMQKCNVQRFSARPCLERRLHALLIFQQGVRRFPLSSTQEFAPSELLTFRNLHLLERRAWVLSFADLLWEGHAPLERLGPPGRLSPGGSGQPGACAQPSLTKNGHCAPKLTSSERGHRTQCGCV